MMMRGVISGCWDRHRHRTIQIEQVRSSVSAPAHTLDLERQVQVVHEVLPHWTSAISLLRISRWRVLWQLCGIFCG